MSDKEFRQYQSDLIYRTAVSVRDHKHTICQSPTGSGKSFVMSATAGRANSKGTTVLVLSETKKIFQQLVIECQAESISSKTDHIFIHPGRTYVAMSQSLVNRPAIISQLVALGPNLLTLVDECHIGTFNKLLDQLPHRRIGYSATPALRWAKHLTTYYKDLVPGPQVGDLINDGYLCSYKHFERQTADLSRLSKAGGEYTERSQEAVFGTQQVYANILWDLRELSYKKCIVFTSSIKQCDALADHLAEHGHKVCRYHSKTEEADYELAKFTELHQADICVSVAALTKGWDYKPIDLVILARATTSLPLYLQMLGRASRILAGKAGFYVVDYGANCTRHGFYFQDRSWDKMWQNKGKAGEGVAPVKTCKLCEYICPASAPICPNCGAVFPRTEKEEEAPVDTKLVELTKKYSSLVGRRLSTLSPFELATYAKMCDKKKFAARIAKAHEQEEPGWLGKYAEAMGYKNTWAIFQIGMMSSEKIDYADLTIR